MPLAEPPYLRERQPWRTLRRPRSFHRGAIYSIEDISAELMSDPERQLLLLCGPEQGGWGLGAFHDGCWRDFTDLGEVLAPTHFVLLPEEPTSRACA
jgi:hypothetical protein